MTKTVLLVSPHFPPSPLAGAHRVRHMAKHLLSHGWRPVVICPRDEAYEEPLDLELAQKVPQSVEQVKVGALDAKLCRRIGVGDISLRAYPFFASALDQAIRRYQPSAVFITSMPSYTLLLGRRVKRRHGLPVVLDFQDPWVNEAGAALPRWSKGGLAHLLAASLEPLALRAADFVTSVSEVQNNQMAARYPWLDAASMAAIPIGGDPDDFGGQAKMRASRDHVKLTYVGAYWDKGKAGFQALFQALALLRSINPNLAGRLRLEFIGTGAPGGEGDQPRRVLELAARAGVDDLVEEFPARVPLSQAIDAMIQADALLMIGSDEPHYTPSKVYPSLMARRPYLALYHRESPVMPLLRQAGGGFALDVAGDPAHIAAALGELAERPELMAPSDPAAYDAFTAHSVAGAFAKIFEQVST